MLCPKCGQDVGESKFCPECGTPINNNENVKEEAMTSPVNSTENEICDTQDKNEVITENTSGIKTITSASKKGNKKVIIGTLAAFIVLLAIILSIALKPKIVKINAKYDGDTSALVILDKKNKGIIVTGEKKNGKTVNLSNWEIEEPKELKADESASVIISYKECRTELKVKCSTSQALKISASYDGSLEDKTVVSKNQITVKATLKNGEEVDVTNDCTFDPESVTLETDGEYSIIVKYTDPVSGEELENELKLICSTLSIKSISAVYKGSTKAGTLIDENNKDIVVTGELKDGTKKTLSGWKISKPAELKEDGTVTVEITYDKFKCNLDIICSDMSESKYKASCQSVSYDSLSRYPGKYEGTYVKVTGKVFQVISESSSPLYYSVYFIRSNGNLYYVRINNYSSDSRILEGDTITVWGTFDEIYTYETIRGNANSVPQITAEYWS
ncbi:MAG: zinc ribbon domain-containing protein [Clostridia bacterium]|nr:zinc ribbon domain-containing protein [Clostridia bacterium]